MNVYADPARSLPIQLPDGASQHAPTQVRGVADVLVRSTSLGTPPSAAIPPANETVPSPSRRWLRQTLKNQLKSRSYLDGYAERTGLGEEIERFLLRHLGNSDPGAATVWAGNSLADGDRTLAPTSLIFPGSLAFPGAASANRDPNSPILVDGVTQEGRDVQPASTLTICGPYKPTPMLAVCLTLLGHALWPVMKSERWWVDKLPQRCIWASCAAAEFLRRQGFEAIAVSAVLEAWASDLNGVLYPGVTIGLPQTRSGVPSAHNVVLIKSDGVTWLLETSLWQIHRGRFGWLPGMIVCHTSGPIEDQPMFKQLVSRSGAEFLAFQEVGHHLRKIGLGWGLMPHRTDWQAAGDADPQRSDAVANRLCELLSQRTRR